MSKKTINGKIKIFYPFDKDDVIQDITEEEKIAKAKLWNENYEAKNNYVSKRKEGAVT